jgi:flagellar basal body-associated protein FliL
MNYHNQNGFITLIIALVLILVAVVGVVFLRVLKANR